MLADQRGDILLVTFNPPEKLNAWCDALEDQYFDLLQAADADPGIRAAAGLGFVEALYADVRFATPEARFLSVFARRGLVAEYGIAWLLPRVVGQSRALDILWP